MVGLILFVSIRSVYFELPDNPTWYMKCTFGSKENLAWEINIASGLDHIGLFAIPQSLLRE